MIKHKKDKKWIGAGVVTAITASLCCITPVLALFAGASGIASTFSWIEPFRPYLIWITILILGFVWVQKLKTKKQEIDCECDEEDKQTFWQSKLFLGLVTIFAGVMLAFPQYSSIFYPKNDKTTVAENRNKTIKELKVQVKGMTCESCNLHIEHEVSKLSGYIDATADYKTGMVKVAYDTLKTSKQEVIKTINNTGYTIID